MKKLGFENITQVVISVFVFGGMIGFVAYGIINNVIFKQYVIRIRKQPSLPELSAQFVFNP